MAKRILEFSDPRDFNRLETLLAMMNRINVEFAVHHGSKELIKDRDMKNRTVLK